MTALAFAAGLLPIFLVGLLGSVHCIGMCGGIVSAFSVAGTPGRRIPIAVVAQPMPRAVAAPPGQALLRVLAYNSGRIGSYMLAGAIAGGAASGARALLPMAALGVAFYWLANLMLVALGLYLMNAWRGLARLESLGQGLWRRVQPFTTRLLPVDSAGKALLLGGLWGWLPCGMVYSVLLTALLSGSAVGGAAVMLAFGLGTLPMLLGLGLIGTRLRTWTGHRAVRIGAGVVVLGFGLLGLARAALGAAPGWLDALCLTPGVHG
jgi:sulfite exporter TauE/SafE